MIDHIKLVFGWRVTREGLRKAEARIRQECDEKLIAQRLKDFEEFLEHNELECALNMLEEACEAFIPSRDVWRLMAASADSMKLEGQAAEYRQKASWVEN